MQPYYRLSLKKNDTTWWALIGDSVVASAVIYYLSKDDIANWEDTTIVDERNLENSGFIRSYGERFEFVNNGRKILRELWDRMGPNGSVILYVETLVSTTQQYEFSYQVDINFLMAEDEDGMIFTVDTVQKDVQEMMKTKEDHLYEIPVSTSPVTVNCRAMRVNGKAKYVTAWPRTPNTSTTASFSASSGYKLPLVYTKEGGQLVPVVGVPGNAPIKEGDGRTNDQINAWAIGGQSWKTRTVGPTTGTQIPYSDSYQFGETAPYNILLEANVPLYNVGLQGRIPFYVQNLSGVTGRYRVRIGAYTPSAPVNPYLIWGEFRGPDLANNASATFAIDINTLATKFEMVAGAQLVIEADFLSNSGATIVGGHQVAWEQDAVIDVTFQHLTNDFAVYGMKIYDVGKELVKRMTNGNATLTSNLLGPQSGYTKFFDLIPKDMVILSGDSIRYGTSAKIKIKWSDYIKSLIAICGVGYGVEGDTVRIEKRGYFYNNNRHIAELGEASTMTVSHARDFLYSLVEVGTDSDVSDDLNGREEYNSLNQFSLPIPNTKNTLDLVSPIRTDGWGIFGTWANYASTIDERRGRDTKDDNTLFILQTRYYSNDAVYALDLKYPDAVVAGVTDGSRVMNLGLTPKRCLLRNMDLLKSLFYCTDPAFSSVSNTLIFQSGRRNTGLSAMLQNGTIIENTDLNLNQYSNFPRLFIPRVYEIRVKHLRNYLQLWKDNPYGYFSFTYKGKTYKGFPIKSEVKNAKPQAYTYTLLAHPDDGQSA